MDKKAATVLEMLVIITICNTIAVAL